jgi:CheY-like chemotaxis protein
MQSSPNSGSSGKDLVSEKSLLMQKLSKIPPLRCIMVIDDNVLDSDHVAAVLHLLLGRDITIVKKRLMPAALEALRTMKPDLVFLDDYLPPLDRAESSIKGLARFGYTGPVVIMSGNFSRTRKMELAKYEPLALLAKDDINSFAIAEVLSRLAPSSS